MTTASRKQQLMQKHQKALDEAKKIKTELKKFEAEERKRIQKENERLDAIIGQTITKALEKNASTGLFEAVVSAINECAPKKGRSDLIKRVETISSKQTASPTTSHHQQEHEAPNHNEGTSVASKY